MLTARLTGSSEDMPGIKEEEVATHSSYTLGFLSLTKDGIESHIENIIS